MSTFLVCLLIHHIAPTEAPGITPADVPQAVSRTGPIAASVDEDDKDLTGLFMIRVFFSSRLVCFRVGGDGTKAKPLYIDVSLMPHVYLGLMLIFPTDPPRGKNPQPVAPPAESSSLS